MVMGYKRVGVDGSTPKYNPKKNDVKHFYCSKTSSKLSPSGLLCHQHYQKCPYSKLFWSVFSRIREILVISDANPIPCFVQ